MNAHVSPDSAVADADETWTVAGRTFRSRLIVGTGKYKDYATNAAAARAALKPGGILAVWSAGSDDAFTRRLRSAGFLVEEVAVRARDNGKGPRHVIWFAQKG